MTKREISKKEKKGTGKVPFLFNGSHSTYICGNIKFSATDVVKDFFHCHLFICPFQVSGKMEKLRFYCTGK